MSKLIEIDEAEFDEVVLQSETPVLIDFWGPGCKPCLVLASIIEELAADFDDKVSFVKVNVEECPAIASRYGVMGLPTLITFKAGQPVDTIFGLTSKDKLKKSLENVLFPVH